MSETTRPTLPPIGILFRDAWKTCQTNFSKLAVTIGAPILLQFLFLMFGPGSGLTFIFVILVSILSLIAGLAAVYILVRGLSVSDAYRLSTKNFFPYAWFAFLQSVVLVGGFMMAIIPGIVFEVWFCLAIFIFAADDKRGFAPLLVSKEYIRGYWWPVLGRMLLLIIPLAVLNGFLVGSAKGLHPSVGVVISSLFALLITPFALSYVYQLFNQFRNLKPELQSAPVAGPRKFFIFSAIFGIVMPVLILIVLILALGSAFLQGKLQLPENSGFPTQGV